MSNNKQSMKLYTEEQVNKAMLLYLQGFTRMTIFEQHLTPIELPSDEDIEEAESQMPINTFELGAKWMRYKIQGEDNEQQ